jgi:hypothetical protein
VELDEPSKRAYLARANARRTEIFTIDPAPFHLTNMIQSPRPFQTKIVDGHFERGGTAFVQRAVVTIRRVIYAEKLAAESVRPSEASYILFGDNREHFLAHRISARPNFDFVSQIQTNESFGELLGNAPHKILSVPGAPDTNPLPTMQNLEGIVEGTGPTFSLTLLRSIYLEFGDLQN